MKSSISRRQQRGVTLIELMIGIAIGLLVVTVSMAAMMVSRSISGTVSDASAIQLQGSYAMRTIGAQLRQTGSLFLNPDFAGSAPTDPLSAVIFETNAQPASGLAFKQEDTISGGDSNITTAFRRYKDAVFTSTTPITLARNCLGGPADDATNKDEAVKSAFTFNSTKNEVLCNGNDGPAAQPIVQNVAQFQATYMEQVFDATGSTIKYVAAADVTDWRSVQGVQVCLVLYGDESISMPAGSTYTDCTGANVDMTTLTGQQKNRMHLAFRNTFQLRSQGLL